MSILPEITSSARLVWVIIEFAFTESRTYRSDEADWSTELNAE